MTLIEIPFRHGIAQVRQICLEGLEGQEVVQRHGSTGTVTVTVTRRLVTSESCHPGPRGPRPSMIMMRLRRT